LWQAVRLVTCVKRILVNNEKGIPVSPGYPIGRIITAVTFRQHPITFAVSPDDPYGAAEYCRHERGDVITLVNERELFTKDIQRTPRAVERLSAELELPVVTRSKRHVVRSDIYAYCCQRPVTYMLDRATDGRVIPAALCYRHPMPILNLVNNHVVAVADTMSFKARMSHVQAAWQFTINGRFV
jgi:hypothetical protein